MVLIVLTIVSSKITSLKSAIVNSISSKRKLLDEVFHALREREALVSGTERKTKGVSGDDHS